MLAQRPRSTALETLTLTNTGDPLSVLNHSFHSLSLSPRVDAQALDVEPTFTSIIRALNTTMPEKSNRENICRGQDLLSTWPAVRSAALFELLCYLISNNLGGLILDVDRRLLDLFKLFGDVESNYRDLSKFNLATTRALTDHLYASAIRTRDVDSIIAFINAGADPLRVVLRIPGSTPHGHAWMGGEQSITALEIAVTGTDSRLLQTLLKNQVVITSETLRLITFWNTQTERRRREPLAWILSYLMAGRLLVDSDLLYAVRTFVYLEDEAALGLIMEMCQHLISRTAVTHIRLVLSAIIICGRQDILEQLLEARESDVLVAIRTSSEDLGGELSLLWYALRSGRTGIVEVLLKNGACVERARGLDDREMAAGHMQYAVGCGSQDTVQLLRQYGGSLDDGADIWSSVYAGAMEKPWGDSPSSATDSIGTSRGISLINIAIYNRDVGMVRSLISSDAPLSGWEFFAALEADVPELVAYFSDQGRSAANIARMGPRWIERAVDIATQAGNLTLALFVYSEGAQTPTAKKLLLRGAVARGDLDFVTTFLAG